MALPNYVNDACSKLNMRPDWRGCCVPLAISMATRTCFYDVVIAMRVTRAILPNGGVRTGQELPGFFKRLGISPAMRRLKEEYGDQRPTVTQYFGQLHPMRRHILTKNGHAIFAEPATRQVYDSRGIFPERRCRMNTHFELTIEDCLLFKQNLAEFLDSYYKRFRTNKETVLRAITFKKRVVRRRVVRRVWR